ncbi:hypothetical protein MRB53_039483 [Persea americana]|nr:hypothetical protein MRB53_039483 [Persea americana]
MPHLVSSPACNQPHHRSAGDSFRQQRSSSPDDLHGPKGLDYVDLCKAEGGEEGFSPTASTPNHNLTGPSASGEVQPRVLETAKASDAPESPSKPSHVSKGTTVVRVQRSDDIPSTFNSVRDCFPCDKRASSPCKKRSWAPSGRKESNAKRRVTNKALSSSPSQFTATWGFSMLASDPHQPASNSKSPSGRHLSPSSTELADDSDFIGPDLQNKASKTINQHRIIRNPIDGSAATRQPISKLVEYSARLYNELQERLALRQKLLQDEYTDRVKKREIAYELEMRYVEHLERQNAAEAKELGMLQRDQAFALILASSSALVAVSPAIRFRYSEVSESMRNLMRDDAPKDNLPRSTISSSLRLSISRDLPWGPLP